MRSTALSRQLRHIVASTTAQTAQNQLSHQVIRAFGTCPRAFLDHQTRNDRVIPSDKIANASRPSIRRHNAPDDAFKQLELSIASESDFIIDPNNPTQGHKIPILQRIRVVPDSPSYFSASPNFTDEYLRVEALYLKWKALPRMANPPDILWHTFEEAKAMGGNEPVLLSRYRRQKSMLKDLSTIEPVVMPAEVRSLLDQHKRAYQPKLQRPKAFDVDEWGRSLGVGKRKTSTAKAYLVMGEGEVLVNGQRLTEAFPRLHDRESALWPLKIADRMDKYNLFAVVGGGGVTGQAEALTLAVARALLVHEPALEERLLRAGCLYRDPRVVERKKTGHLKARKMPAWVKR